MKPLIKFSGFLFFNMNLTRRCTGELLHIFKNQTDRKNGSFLVANLVATAIFFGS